MPTQEVLNQWEASSPTTKSEGPLQGTSNPPQSLVSKHECFAARPNAEVCPTCNDRRLAVDQDRVRNSGARTPGSIHADIVAQIDAKRERKASEEAEKDKKKAEVEKST
ncbi:hypothetical protein H9Q69_003296 [Fusarium xylarioides]|uniref:Uncharacterized protein n=1 Tax=Fusarium xylarioides TaxID=221167 RepID=A0A9P7HSX1_9HYPO|nr:hypothetical protein H9Q70_013366 [Fusarium xylarioides]KAG5765031.1 hypothetical protein H9Q72_006874 [Fusarium xylarioides]KAG5772397.1 hypothetical protein H9Q73_012490 [Fusarium xylarioides]KAG5797700.1 hypothetical protein H9Q69_003296 [Fusarium xylarioides]KAG5810097.1 hypothetical protein H9Q71_005717 [Fusarium xylarioides]